tara:strand:+ start:378 stop:1388 length:1011 start_codon:yes stop_codon:yes gene_type:complete
MRGFDENNNLINFNVKENDYKKCLDIDKKNLILLVSNKENRQDELAYFLNENGYDILISDTYDETIELTLKAFIKPNLIIIGDFEFDQLKDNKSFAGEKHTQWSLDFIKLLKKDIKMLVEEGYVSIDMKIYMTLREAKEIPILFCESFSDIHMEKLLSYYPIDDYLSVPFYKIDLLQKIKKLISINSFEEGKKFKRQGKSIFKDTYSINSKLEKKDYKQVKNKDFKYIKTEDESVINLREFFICFLSVIAIILIFTNKVYYSVILFIFIIFLLLLSETMDDPTNYNISFIKYISNFIKNLFIENDNDFEDDLQVYFDDDNDKKLSNERLWEENEDW